MFKIVAVRPEVVVVSKNYGDIGQLVPRSRHQVGPPETNLEMLNSMWMMPQLLHLQGVEGHRFSGSFLPCMPIPNPPNASSDSAKVEMYKTQMGALKFLAALGAFVWLVRSGIISWERVATLNANARQSLSKTRWEIFKEIGKIALSMLSPWR